MKNEKHSQQQAPEDGAGPVLPAGWHFALTLTPDADGELGGVAELHEHDTRALQEATEVKDRNLLQRSRGNRRESWIMGK